MTKMKPVTSPRTLFTAAALSLASLSWGQPAPSAPQPAATPAPAPAATTPATVGPAAPAAPAAGAPAPGQILPAPDRSTPVGSTIAGGLASSSTVAALQRQEFENRDQLLNEVSSRFQQADRQVSELKQKATGLDAEAKQSLDTAVADYEKAKAKLQQSLDASRNTQANTWERARVSLATDYAFYVAAAAAVEVAAPNT